MKKYIKLSFAVAFTVTTGLGVYIAQEAETMSDLMLANVEALARYEDSGCPNGCLSDGGGCTCNGVHYPDWKEKEW